MSRRFWGMLFGVFITILKIKVPELPAEGAEGVAPVVILRPPSRVAYRPAGTHDHESAIPFAGIGAASSGDKFVNAELTAKTDLCFSILGGQRHGSCGAGPDIARRVAHRIAEHFDPSRVHAGRSGHADEAAGECREGDR